MVCCELSSYARPFVQGLAKNLIATPYCTTILPGPTGQTQWPCTSSSGHLATTCLGLPLSCWPGGCLLGAHLLAGQCCACCMSWLADLAPSWLATTWLPLGRHLA